MNPQNVWLKRLGLVLNVLVAALILFAASGKVLGNIPPEAAEKLKDMGLDDKIRLIGWGEIITAILLVVPRTSPLGTLTTSGFWGGVICINMARHEEFIPWIVMLLVTWIGSYLRGSVPLLKPAAAPAAASTAS